MKIIVTSGTGDGPTALAAFDAALLHAGVAHYNLIALSSIIPPGSVIERSAYRAPPDAYGQRLYVVLARCDQARPGHQAWAGIGWVQEPDSGQGLFVEVHGASEARVHAAITVTLTAMMGRRCRAYGPIGSAITGIACHARPVCALVVAVYQSEGWA